jgi:hypothetical protein
MSTSSDSIRVVGEKDLLDLSRIPRGTWSAWIRNGHFEGRPDGLYGEGDVISAVVFSLLADALAPRKAAIAWKDCGAATIDACLGLPLKDEDETLALAIDGYALTGVAAKGPIELFKAVHQQKPSPRNWIVIPLSALVREARSGFWKRARPASELKKDGRRRSPKSRLERQSASD